MKTIKKRGLSPLFLFVISIFKAAKTASIESIVLLLALLISTADAIYGRIKLQQTKDLYPVIINEWRLAA